MRTWRDTDIIQSRFARFLLLFAYWWDGVPYNNAHDPATTLDVEPFRWN